MTESEVFAKFAEFGYYVLKTGNKYSLFDRRTGRRIREYNELDGLIGLADLLAFDLITEIFNRTINEFKKVYGLIDDADARNPEPEPNLEPEAEKKSEKEPEQANDAPVFDLICKGCGKHFQSSRKKAYCSEVCYPSKQEKKPSEETKVFQRPF